MNRKQIIEDAKKLIELSEKPKKTEEDTRRYRDEVFMLVKHILFNVDFRLINLGFKTYHLEDIQEER